jgi:hypothetical protein
MLVPWTSLGPLVRSTVIFAYYACKTKRLQDSFFNFGYEARMEDLKTITNRHSVPEWTFETLISSLYPRSNTEIAQ